jgi:hypothetical protein
LQPSTHSDGQASLRFNLGLRRRQTQPPLTVPEERVQIEEPCPGSELEAGDAVEARMLHEHVRVRAGPVVVRQYAGDVEQGIGNGRAFPIDEYEAALAVDEVGTVKVVMKDGHGPIRRALPRALLFNRCVLVDWSGITSSGGCFLFAFAPCLRC